MMKSIVAAIAVMAACDQREYPLEITLDTEGAELSNGAIVYQNNGAFLVHVTATFDAAADADDREHNLASLTADVFLSANAAAPSSISKATLIRLDRTSAVFAGAAMVSWPNGGPVTVTARVAGVEKSQAFTLAVPALALVIGKAAANTGNGTVDVPFCVVSSARTATVALHLDKATLAPNSETDKSLALLLGPCTLKPEDIATPAPDGFDVQAHATLTLTTSAPVPSITATLPSPVMGTPPLDVLDYALPSLTIPPRVDRVTFTKPAPATARPGDVVIVEVKAIDAAGAAVQGVTEAFTGTAEIVFIPPTAKTNALGLATTSFVMPDVEGGFVLVGATGAAPLAIATVP